MAGEADTLTCSACGQANRPGRRFCTQCGTRLDPICSSCGERNEAGDHFCGYCGATLGETAPVSRDTPASAASTDPLSSPRQTGTTPSSVSSGRYRIDRFLGEGAKKRVFLADDTRLDRQVAIALVAVDGLDASGLDRVRREAEAMGRLGDHPNVVTVFDVVEEADQVIIVSRYVPGGDVEARLRDATGNRLSIAEALGIAVDVAAALQHAHERDIIHRDVKPGNVWLANDGTALLGDFGLAAVGDRPRLTSEGTMLGTVAYMPPEQAMGRTADARSDLYSLGALLYEMLTGRPPFPGDDTVGVIAQHLNSPPVRPSWHEKKIPRELDDLVLRLLAKDPDERPSAAGEVSEALAEIARIEADRSSSVHDSRSEETLPPATLGLFVGRDRELGQLQEVFTRVLAGEGSLAMVVGEPGIGKTRLTKEFSVHARLRGAEVFLGPCYEGEGWVPYQPFVEALRLYVRAHPDDAELRTELGEGAPELATLVPEIRERVPDIADALPLEGEDERKRLFESMSRFLQRAAATKPLVLVLDDLHWADKPTLLLLLHLARHIRHDRVLLLGTYRDVELERTHPLAETVAKLRSDGLYERVLLRGLTLEGVRDLLSAKSGDDVPLGFVEPILRETEGNPFFVEEVIKHLIEVGAVRREGDQWVADLGVIERSLPEGVREVIGHRLNRLSEPCNSMLTVASAMTGGFSFEVLTRVCDEGEGALLDRLDEALRAQVIRDRGDAGEAIYEFSHALIRQTLYQELSTPRRVRLHRQIGEALEQLYGLDSELYAAELAHHFFQGAPGGDVDKAIETSIRAAERARRLMAWDEAASHGARAVEAFEMKGDRDPARHFELLFGLGEAERLAGERTRARTTLARAAEIARQLGDAETFARAILSYSGEDVTVPFDTPDVLELLEEALERIDGGDSELRLRLLSRLAIGLIFDSDPERRNEKLSREAVDMARRIGEPRWLCRALIIDDIISPLSSDLEVELERSREKLELAEQAGNSELVLNARLSHINNSMHTGDAEGLERQIAEYGRLAAELRQPAMYWFAATQRALLAMLRGPLDEAQARIEEAREAGERGELPLGEFFYTVQSLILEIEQAPPGAATEAALAFWDTRIGKLISVGGSACSTHLRLGDIARARELFEATARRHFADIPLDNNWIGRMYSTAATGVQLADAERAPELYDLLLPYADFMAVAGPVSLCYGPVHQILGRLAFLMGRAEVGVRHFEASLEKTERLGFAVLLARFRFQFGECLVARGAPGDHARAHSLISDALTAAEALGMKVLVQEALAVKLRLQDAESSGVKQSVYLVADAVEARQPDIGAHAAPDGTVTLLFSDMAGFTAMTERLGDLRAREVIRVHNRTVRDQLEAHGGYEVELQGDGFLLAFGSARQALLCAIAIQRALADYNRGHREEPISVRIGVHTGEALKDADKFFGRTVILAARIADQAEGGEILVSSIVRELTANAGDIRFGSEREVALKGISASQRLMRVEWPVG